MMRRNPLGLGLSLLLLSLGSVGLGGESHEHREASAGIQQRWKLPTGGSVVGSAIQGQDGHIYLLSENRYLYILSQAGNIVEKINTYRSFSGPFSLGRDGSIYIGVGTSSLMVLNGKGDRRWMRRLDAPMGENLLVGGGGESYALLDTGELVSYSPGGSLRWKVPLGIRASLAMGMDELGRLVIPGDDQFIYALLPWGTRVWRFRLAGVPTVYSLLGAEVLCGTSAGTLVMIDESGILKWQVDLGEAWRDMVHNGREIVVSSESGRIVCFSLLGEILWEQRIDSRAPQLFLADDSLMALGRAGDIHLLGLSGAYYGSLVGAAAGDGALLCRDGLFLVGGQDWLLYAYDAPSLAAGAWSQQGGNEARTWTATGNHRRYWLEFFQADPDFLAIGALVSNGLEQEDIPSLHLALEAIEEGMASQERYIREPYLLYYLERIITQHITERRQRDSVQRDYPSVRLRALELLAQLETGYSSPIYKLLIEHEWNDAVLMQALENFSKLASDPDGSVTRAIAHRILDGPVDEPLAFSLLNGLYASSVFRGEIPASSVIEAALELFRESGDRRTKKLALELLRY